MKTENPVEGATLAVREPVEGETNLLIGDRPLFGLVEAAGRREFPQGLQFVNHIVSIYENDAWGSHLRYRGEEED